MRAVLARPGRGLRRRGAGRRVPTSSTIGLASTDQLYFASGSLDLPGAMFTASHNPAQYNGIKLCRAGAAPIGQDTGLAEIRDAGRAASVAEPAAAEPGTVTGERDLLAGVRRATCAAGRLSADPAAEGRRRRRQRHGRAHRAGGLRRAAVDAGPAVLRARRHASPTTRPTRSTRRTCVDLQAAVRRDGRRPRPGLRRRRRPLLRRRRARRAGLAVGGHRAGRRPRAGQATRARRSSTT